MAETWGWGRGTGGMERGSGRVRGAIASVRLPRDILAKWASVTSAVQECRR